MSDDNKNGTSNPSENQHIFYPQRSNNGRSLKMPIYNPDTSPAPGVPFERRHKRDRICAASSFCAALTWVFVGACVAMIAKAQPRTADFFSRTFGIPVERGWDIEALRVAFLFITAAFVICLAGLILKSFRNRRKTDRYGISSLVAAVVSVVGAIILGISVF